MKFLSNIPREKRMCIDYASSECTKVSVKIVWKVSFFRWLFQLAIKKYFRMYETLYQIIEVLSWVIYSSILQRGRNSI